MDRHEQEPVLGVGDPTRLQARNVFLATLLAGIALVCFALISTQVKGIRAHSPWQDDPYDGIVSFTIFFVPLLLGLAVIHASLCRSGRPLPVSRLRALSRVERSALLLIAITLAADWVSILVGEHRDVWDRWTALLAGLLAISSLVCVAAVVMVARLRLPSSPSPVEPDALADLETIADEVGLSISVLRRPAELVRTVAGASWGVRRHPILWAGVGATCFGLGLASTASFEEGLSPVLGLFVIVGAAGMFAFGVLAGSYLNVVSSSRPASGASRRLIDASVLAAASVPFALAFRDRLWGFIHADSDVDVVGLYLLLAVMAVATGLTTFVVESALGTHRA